MQRAALVLMGALIVAFTGGVPRDASAGFLDKLKAAKQALQHVGDSRSAAPADAGQDTNTNTKQDTSASGNCPPLSTVCDHHFLDKFAACQEKMYGYQEHVTADRLEKKLAISPQLNAKERAVWQADIAALRAVTYAHRYEAPDPKNELQYADGLTRQEQIAVTSMNARNRQKVFIECEQEHPNGLSSPADEQKYIASLRAKMPEATDISTLPLQPLPSPFPKSQAELAKERAAAEAAQRADTQKKMAKCLGGANRLRLEATADRLQQKLDAAQGLSARQRADFVADIEATRAAAAQGLSQPAPVDPKNPFRAMTRLDESDQLAISAAFQQRYIAYLQTCTR